MPRAQRSNKLNGEAAAHQAEDERRRLEAVLAALRERTEQARRLASALALAEQKERRRVSELLHDHVQQVLYGIQLKLKVLSMSDPAEIRSRIDEVQQLIDGAIDAVRTMSVELTPPILRGEGMQGSLAWLAAHMERTYGLSVDVDVRKGESPIEPDMQALLVQLVRELLFNVVKHAGVTRALVRVESDDGELLVTVEDKGKGFEMPAPASPTLAEGGLGLQSVRERIELFRGTIQLWSSPRKGTRVTIRLPVDQSSD